MKKAVPIAEYVIFALYFFDALLMLICRTWSERRRFAKVKKKERQLQRPSLPEGTKLITFPILEPG